MGGRLGMNVRSLYRMSTALESILQDIVNKDADEEEVLEMLIDAKRIIDLMGQELNNYINNNYINNNYINNKKNQGT